MEQRSIFVAENKKTDSEESAGILCFHGFDESIFSLKNTVFFTCSLLLLYILNLYVGGNNNAV